MSKETSIDALVERLNYYIKASDEAHKIQQAGLEKINEELKTLNGKVVKNTEYRIKMIATINTFKWIFSILGIGNIAVIIKILLM